MRELGPITRLQIQKHVLRTGPDRLYGTAGIIECDSILLTSDGVLAPADGGWLIDRHHGSHPQNQEGNPDRRLSFGFTSHYELMEAHFGSAPLGVAAENIIIETDARVFEADLAAGVVIKTSHGEIELPGPVVAQPCVPFTKFMLDDPDAPPEVVGPNRDFLRQGMRGFVVGTASLTGPVEVAVGDLVYIRQD